MAESNRPPAGHRPPGPGGVVRKPVGRDPDTVLRPVHQRGPEPGRPERRVRDLDSPTAQFPVGAMYRAVQQRKGADKGGSGPGLFEGEDDETELLDWDEDADEDDSEFSEPTRRRTLDLWFFALWLAAAGVLGLLAAVAATAAVLYR